MPGDYQKKLEQILPSIEECPALLLHACCAPCASRALELLSPHFIIDILFYNPNIRPEREYFKRLGEMEKLLNAADYPNAVRILEAPRRHEDFERAAAGYEAEAEGGARCALCFELRLFETGRRALADGYDYFASTLTVGPGKNPDVINVLGYSAAERFGTKWLPADFKKRNGFLRSVQLSQKYGLYRQNYCGCGY